MKYVPGRFGAPLLGKELIELAARKRTYVLRFLFALVLFGISGLTLWTLMYQADYDVLRLLGNGRWVFSMLVGVEMWGVYLLLPAIMAPAITYEKERNALELLILTGIGPWQIILQKFFGRLVPTVSFILLSLPVIAMAYSYGGFDVRLIFATGYTLMLACFQVGAIALMCSAFSNTTGRAFIRTYTTLILLYIGTGLFIALAAAKFDATEEFVMFVAGVNPPWLMMYTMSWFGSMGDLLVNSIPAWATIGIALVLARHWLITRAHISGPAPATRLRRWMDRKRGSRPAPRALRDDAVPGLAGAGGESDGVVFKTPTQAASRKPQAASLISAGDIPGDKPIAWRELRTRWVGRPTHISLLLLVIMVPLLSILALCRALDNDAYAAGLVILMVFMWPIALLTMVNNSVAVMSAERSHQSLEVLLTTPLTGREIVSQKMAPLRRLMAVMAVPLLALVALTASYDDWRFGRGRSHASGIGTYVAVAILCIAVYLPLFAWLGAAVALRTRSQARAVILAMLLAMAWCLGPLAAAGMFVLFVALGTGAGDPSAFAFFLVNLSPAATIVCNESGMYDNSDAPLASAVAALIVNAILAAVLCYTTYNSADRCLGRTAGRNHQ